MRHAAASLLLHLGLIGGAWLAWQSRPPETPTDLESVAIDIVTVETVAVSQPVAVASKASVTQVSSGAVATTPAPVAAPQAMTAPTVEPIRPVTTAATTVATSAEPVDAVSAAVLMAATADPIATDALVPLATAAEALVVAPAAPHKTDAVPLEKADQVAKLETLEPVSATDVPAPPVPRPRTERPDPPAEPVREATRQVARETPKAKPASTTSAAGNAGRDAADSTARASSGGKGQHNAGGSAAVSKYPGIVQARVNRAARYPARAKGASGEVRVRFTVAANGRVSQVSVIRSSGNAALDDAATKAVTRAAPFPPIPAEAGRSTWRFDVPLAFDR